MLPRAGSDRPKRAILASSCARREFELTTPARGFTR
jgi:hypothetical protein